MKAEFNKTVDILVKAYLNDTLKHGNCFACAVGNIVANGLGKRVVNVLDKGFEDTVWEGCTRDTNYPGYVRDEITGWGAAFYTKQSSRRQVITKENLTHPIVQNQIDASGYTWQELAAIEKAFESVAEFDNNKMFDGLMNVVDVLASIHNVDLTVKEQAKQLFVKI